jgi:3-phosphoglycerate kinase
MYDVGPATQARYAELVRGRPDRALERPDGRLRTAPFDAGTLAVARALAD